MSVKISPVNAMTAFMSVCGATCAIPAVMAGRAVMDNPAVNVSTLMNVGVACVFGTAAVGFGYLAYKTVSDYFKTDQPCQQDLEQRIAQAMQESQAWRRTHGFLH